MTITLPSDPNSSQSHKGRYRTLPLKDSRAKIEKKTGS
jgi:hypothetical protein